MTINSRTQLVELMKHLNLPLVGAEVGTAECRLSKEFIDWGLERLYLIDIFTTVPFIKGCASFDQSWHNNNYYEAKKLQDLRPEKIIILKGFSYLMAKAIPDESLGLVYVDADHTYEGARTDIDAYWSKLVMGGIMAFHDAKNGAYGIMNAIHDFTKGIGINDLVEDGQIENMGAYIIKKGQHYGE